MQRRIIAAVVAVVLAGIGAVLLYSYVNTADARAMATLETTQVLVANKVVPAGTSGAALAPFVQLKLLPKVAVVEGALTSTADVADLEVTSDFQIGEQVLASRFAKPDTDASGKIDVPSNLQQVTVHLDPSRVFGAQIAAGDKVGVFVSTDTKLGSTTKLAFRDVLVSNVQGAPIAAEGGDDAGVAPSGELLITFAAVPSVATQLVWSAEFAKIYLGLEPKDGDHASKPLSQMKTIFK